MWILACTMRRGYLAVVADSGETPTWADFCSAQAAAYALGLPRCVALEVPESAAVESPTPYRADMTFDACQAEAKHWRVA